MPHEQGGGRWQRGANKAWHQPWGLQQPCGIQYSNSTAVMHCPEWQQSTEKQSEECSNTEQGLGWCAICCTDTCSSPKAYLHLPLTRYCCTWCLPLVYTQIPSWFDACRSPITPATHFMPGQALTCSPARLRVQHLCKPRLVLLLLCQFHGTGSTPCTAAGSITQIGRHADTHTDVAVSDWGAGNNRAAAQV